MPRLFKRKDSSSDVWYGIWYDEHGRRHKESTACTDKRAAADWLKAKERGVYAPKDKAVCGPGLTLKDAVDLFLATEQNISDATRRMYRARAGHLNRVLGGEADVSMLREEELKRFAARRTEEGACRETVRKEFTTLRRVLNASKIPTTCMPEWRVRYVPRKRWLSWEEFKALCLELEEHRRLWVVLACFTGARMTEVSSIEWKDVDFVQKTVRIRGTKTDGSDRFVPLAEELEKLLVSFDKKKGLIAGDWGKVNRDLAAACRRAGIAKASPNDLRRTYASWLKQRNVDSFVVAQLLGHSTSRMVELTYGKLSPATFQVAAKLLPTSTEN